MRAQFKLSTYRFNQKKGEDVHDIRWTTLTVRVCWGFGGRGWVRVSGPGGDSPTRHLQAASAGSPLDSSVPTTCLLIFAPWVLAGIVIAATATAAAAAVAAAVSAFLCALALRMATATITCPVTLSLPPGATPLFPPPLLLLLAGYPSSALTARWPSPLLLLCVCTPVSVVTRKLQTLIPDPISLLLLLHFSVRSAVVA